MKLKEYLCGIVLLLGLVSGCEALKEARGTMARIDKSTQVLGGVLAEVDAAGKELDDVLEEEDTSEGPGNSQDSTSRRESSTGSSPSTKTRSGSGKKKSSKPANPSTGETATSSDLLKRTVAFEPLELGSLPAPPPFKLYPAQKLDEVPKGDEALGALLQHDLTPSDELLFWAEKQRKMVPGWNWTQDPRNQVCFADPAVIPSALAYAQDDLGLVPTKVWAIAKAVVERGLAREGCQLIDLTAKAYRERNQPLPSDLALLSIRCGDYAGAARFDPRFATGPWAFVETVYESGRFDDARQLFHAATNIPAPHKTLGHLNRMALFDPLRAMEALEKTDFADNRNLIAPWWNAGLQYLQRGNIEKSLEWLRAAYEAKSGMGNRESTKMVATLLALRGRPAEALALLEEFDVRQEFVRGKFVAPVRVYATIAVSAIHAGDRLTEASVVELLEKIPATRRKAVTRPLGKFYDYIDSIALAYIEHNRSADAWALPARFWAHDEQQRERCRLTVVKNRLEQSIVFTRSHTRGGRRFDPLISAQLAQEGRFEELVQYGGHGPLRGVVQSIRLARGIRDHIDVGGLARDQLLRAKAYPMVIMDGYFSFAGRLTPNDVANWND